MKFHADPLQDYSIKAHGEGWVQLMQERIEQSVILSSGGLKELWHCASFEQLGAEDLERVAQLGSQAQVILLGTGRKNRFPPPAWLKPFVQYQLGVEAMDTAAACRTYNVLVGEGRKVVAALILETPGDAQQPA